MQSTQLSNAAARGGPPSEIRVKLPPDKTTESADEASSRRRIVLPLVASALLTAAVLAGLLVYLRADAIASGETLLGAIAQLSDEQTTSVIQNVEQTLQVVEGPVSAATEASPTGEGQVDAELRRLVESRSFLKAIRVLDERGFTIYGSDTGNIGVDLSDRDYFAFHREHPDAGLLISKPLLSRAKGAWIIPVSLGRYRADGVFAGVIVGGLDPQFFDQAWALDNKMADLSIALVRQDGLLLMRSPFVENTVGTSIGVAPDFYRIRTGERAGTYRAKSIFDGKDRILAYRRLKAYPSLVIVVGESVDQALVGWRDFAWIVAACWVIAAAALGGLALWRIREAKARRATESRYRDLFEASPYPLLVADSKTSHILAVNDAAAEQYGWSRGEFLAMNLNDLYLPQDVPKVEAMRRLYVPGAARVNSALRHRRKDGKVINVETSGRLIDFEGTPALLAMVQDVTTRHAAEDQLRQAQKMEGVGQLTGGIAHDFNNILFVILANTDALLEDADLSADTKDRLDHIDKAVQRASTLTGQLLSFSRKQPLQPQQTDLNDLVNETGTLLRRALGAQIAIESVLSDDLCVANVDRSQLQTALVNLCINARDAMPDGGRLLIETYHVVLDEEDVASTPDATAGTYAVIAVTDTGEGIPPETLAKVFEPFFTTKEVGKGTGLGLSMVYGFIKQSNGHIKIYSEVGKGTLVKLYLPCSGKTAEAALSRDTAPVSGGTERILVVEDESQVRASVMQQLRSLGYAVSEAADGAGGLAACEAAQQPYALLLTDVVMPGLLNGKDLASEVLRRWPETKIVFMSGFTEISSVRHSRLDKGSVLLTKPFRKRDLAQIVRLALDGTRPPPG